MNRSVLAMLLLAFTVMSCGGGGNGGTTAGNTNTSLNSLDCMAAVAFDPVAAGLNTPIITPAVAPVKNTTIILMHGKTSRPNASFLTTFQTDLAALGYKVIAPSMTWSTLFWRGELCEGLVYINELADIEINAGQEVVLAGHSMGAVYSLMYGVTQSTSVIKAIISMAPGHFMHQSKGLQNSTAADVVRARNLEANNMGDILGTYVTRSAGIDLPISTTATRYLSFHDLSRVPDIKQFASNINLPVLWLSGNNDTLTTKQNHAGLAALISSANSDYKILPASHFSIVAMSPDTINTWLGGL